MNCVLICTEHHRQIATRRESLVLVSDQTGQTIRKADCSSGSFALSPDAKFLIALHHGKIVLHRLLVASSGLSSTKPTDVRHYSDAGDQVAVSRVHPFAPAVEIGECRDPAARIAFSRDSQLAAVAMSHSDFITIWHLPDGRNLGSLPFLAHDVLADLCVTSGGSVVAVTRSGKVQVWEADGNGNAYPWSRELVQITHQPVDSSSVQILRQAQEMRRRGWLSIQESNFLDIALALMEKRLNLDIEIDWETELLGDVYDIEIE